MFGFRRKPPAPTAAQWRTRGNEALARQALAEAEDCYRQAAAADPADASALVNLGYVLLERGRAEEAGTVLASALELAAGGAPDAQADAHFLLARARQANGQTADAIAHYRAALAARPAFDEALSALVALQIAGGDAEAALASAQGAAAAAPSPLRSMLLAQALHACRRGAEALQALDAVLAREPGHLGALEARGNLLLEQGRPGEALAAFEQAVARHGAQPESLCNIAAALLKLERPEEALKCADAALRAQPDSRAALHNKGQALLNLLRAEAARDLTREALERHPGDPDLRWNLAVAHLLLGELAPGFDAHEARWQAAGFGSSVAPEILRRPRWSGAQPLEGKSILLYAEQGLGDSIQFVRYVPQVAAQAREVLLQVQPALAPVLGALAPNVRLLVPGEAIPASDFQCPLLSLPHAFGTTLAAVPAPIPYLQADPARVQAWRARLPADGRPKVGITWSGNPAHSNDRNRSIALAQFRALATPDCTFVTLQPQVRESDRAALEAWPGLLPFGAELRDFADTAALMAALDLVVTVDTSVAHLAGALGRPLWILLPYCPDWRWMLERSDTPWYPGARLYRQPARRSWPEVLQRVRADLERLA